MVNRLLKFIFCLGLFTVLTGPMSFASHMIGGDITYKCLGNNRFQITITLFQDALSGLPSVILMDNPADYAIYTQGPNPVLVTYGSVSASSTDTIPPGFSNDCINNYPDTKLRRQIFIFDVTLNPSDVGYYIVYQRCCRNATISNIVTPGNVGVTYLAEIPPFTSGECPNNSAVFKSLPPQIICVNTPFSYDFSASDMDSDSLSYEFCDAHPGGGPNNAKPSGNQIAPPPYTSIQYLPPYTSGQPVPGTPPFTIDPVTGVLSGTPTQTGRFIVTVCCHEWRNGTIVNTLSRDVQFVITDCSKNVVADIPVLTDLPNTYIVECEGYTVNFINTSSGGNTYHWDFGVPGATSTQFEPSYTYPDTGTYKVKLVVNPGTTCTDSITRLVKVYPVFKAGFIYAGKMCAGEPIQFTDTSFATFPPVISWKWSFGDGQVSTEQNPAHTYAAPGGAKTVTLTAQTAIGCRDTASVELPLGYLDVFAGNDTIIVKGYPFSLNGTGAQYYDWSPPTYLSSASIADPATNFPDTGKYVYVLTGSTEQGCVASDSITIWVVSGGIVFVPTGFTPNGDGRNDYIKPIIVGYTKIDNFRIFNRYGQTVYMSSVDNAPSWDGTMNGQPCDMGTYFWVMTVTNVTGQKETQKGDITLIR